MQRTILTAPAGAGKTEAMINAILQTERQGFAQEVWVLLPTTLQIEAFRERLLQAADLGAIFNIRFFSFYELYDHLLDLSGSPQRVLRQSASNRILRYVIRELKKQRKGLLYYETIADTPGFVKLVSDFIEELKQGIIRYNEFGKTIKSDKDADLDEIYTRYQLFLNQHHLADRDGAGWVALEEVQKHPALVSHVGLLVVDGYDQFTPLQMELLNALSAGIQETVVTLTYEDSRRDDVCRLFYRTLNRLNDGAEWSVQTLQRPGYYRPAPLHHLEQYLFGLDAPPVSAETCLTLIEAPDLREEARATMRHIKHLLLDGANPNEMLVVMRQADGYAEALRQAAAAYQVPVAMRQAEAVLSNPAVATVLSLFDLHQQDFPYRQMMDVLWSNYLKLPDLDADDIAALERIGMVNKVVEGRDHWLEAVMSDEPVMDEEGDVYEVAYHPGLSHRLETCFNRITPPENETARGYVAWLEQLLGDDPAYLEQQAVDGFEDHERHTNSLDLYVQVREGEDQAVIVRDLVALRELRSSLLEVLAAYDLLLDTLGRTEQMDWKTFRADLELALQRRRVNVDRDGSRQGRVLVTTAFEARGLHHEHVFILGLSEGIFPAQQNESPLYSDRERRELIENYKLRIQDPAERNRDMGLFYELCSLAKSSLTLTRPTLDPGGNPWSASIYWKTVVNLLPDARSYRIPPGSCPTIEQAASRREAAMSLCQLLNTPEPEITEQTWAYTVWFQQDAIWANIEKGREIERSRETSHLPFDIYSGILSDLSLIDAVRQQLGSSYTWSATQFNELASCGFRFFSSRLLGLEAYKEPEEGMDAMQLGTVNHAILEAAYDEIANRRLAIREENRDEALGILEQKAAVIFRTAPQKYGFRATALWKHEQENMLEKLRWLIHKDFSDDSPFAAVKGERHPLAQEMTFGRDEVMWIELPDLGALRVRGAIDRMDIVDEQTVIIADYKSSHIPTRSDAEHGRNFQMMLYLMAAQELLRRRNLQFRIAGGLFWSIRSGDDSKLIQAEKLDNAEVQLARNILNARQGLFPSKPNSGKADQCVQYCDFGKFCRVHRSHRWKPISMDASVGD